jgi:hypothetical protein
MENRNAYLTLRESPEGEGRYDSKVASSTFEGSKKIRIARF